MEEPPREQLAQPSTQRMPTETGGRSRPRRRGIPTWLRLLRP
jgi:hypothetical protein